MTFLILPGQIPSGEVWFEHDDYTPALTAFTTNPTLGSGSIRSGHWHRSGLWVAGTAFIKFGTSGVAAGSGSYLVSLPLPIDASLYRLTGGTGDGSQIGGGTVRDNSAIAAGSRNVRVQLNSSTTAVLVIADGTNQLVTNAVPFTFAAEDAITFDFGYQIEAGT